jgi:hypothetical protein
MFITNNSPQFALSIGYNGKYIEESANTKFLSLQIDNHLNWKNHVDQMILELSWACCAVGSVFHIVSIDTLKSVYFAYFHSIMKYGIIFWGYSSSSKKIFTLQKKIIKLWLVPSQEICVETYLRNWKFYLFLVNIYFN